MGTPFPVNPAAAWRAAATPDELAEIAALDVVLDFLRRQTLELRARKFRIVNRANTRAGNAKRKARLERGSNATR